MKRYTKMINSLVILLISCAIVVLALAPIALAESIGPDVYDQWNTLEEFEDVCSLRELLIKNDWADERVSLDELDYIMVLSQQLSAYFNNIPAELVLAVISVESGFQKNLTSPAGAEGLMQVIPRYHRERITQYLYDENVDLYDPRVNVMVGTDYLSELLETTEGDIEYALMCYNQGPDSARKSYRNGYVSGYARLVVERMNEIHNILERR